MKDNKKVKLTTQYFKSEEIVTEVMQFPVLMTHQSILLKIKQNNIKDATLQIEKEKTKYKGGPYESRRVLRKYLEQKTGEFR